MKMLLVYFLMVGYGLYELITDFQHQSSAANALIGVNLIGLLTLIISGFYLRKIEKELDRNVELEQEDEHFNQLERKAYSATTYSQVAICLGLLGLIVCFLLFREEHPGIGLASFAIMLLGFFKLYPSEKIINLTNPGFKFPDPKSKAYEKEVFDQFDDGQKYVMLKGLYQLYMFVIFALVLLSFGLMFYSAYTGNSQLVSIIGIIILLMLIQISYTVSLKPNKLR